MSTKKRKNSDERLGSPVPLYLRVWVISGNSDEDLKAVTPSKIPTSVKWQYIDDHNYTWLEDPALTVTGLSGNEKPICECEVTISLCQDTGMGVKALRE